MIRLPFLALNGGVVDVAVGVNVIVDVDVAVHVDVNIPVVTAHVHSAAMPVTVIGDDRAHSYPGRKGHNGRRAWWWGVNNNWIIRGNVNDLRVGRLNLNDSVCHYDDLLRRGLKSPGALGFSTE